MGFPSACFYNPLQKGQSKLRKKSVNVVGAFLQKGEEILICRRPKNKAQALLWEFAGGKVEAGERKQTALVRECKEELDVLIEVGKELCSVSYDYPEVTVNLTVFFATLLKGEPKCLEHEEIRWITVDQIDNFEFCPADVEIIEKIKSL